MAFFGITKLGPQNSFQDSLKKASVITCFAEAEFESAYARVATRRGATTLTADAVPAILEVVYHGPAPETDLLRVQHKLAACGADAELPLGDFLAAVAAAKAEEESWEATQKNIVSGGSEFASSKFYRDHITRHTRMDHAPNEKRAARASVRARRRAPLRATVPQVQPAAHRQHGDRLDAPGLLHRAPRRQEVLRGDRLRRRAHQGRRLLLGAAARP